MSGFTRDILQAASRQRRPVPGETVYIVRKKLANAEHIPPVTQLVNTCYTRRVQLNGIRIIVMGPDVNDYSGEGIFCTYSAYEVFLNYAEALEFAAGVIQTILSGLEQRCQNATDTLKELQNCLALELSPGV